MLIDAKYRPHIVKEYKWWTLLAHETQDPYLGRAVVWWKDLAPNEGEGMRPSDLPPEALLELNRVIFDDMVDVCGRLGYRVDPYGEKFLLNMSYLANMPEHNHHMHWHFVPRSRDIIPVDEKRELIIYNENWGKNYSPYQHRLGYTTPERLEMIRSLMAKAIGGIAHP